MESAPAAFVGVALAVFGAALMLWTTVRARNGEPVAEGVGRVPAVVLVGISGVMSLMAGGWVLLRG
ncbi:hypothetical protein [Streptomyces sp. HNM0574]|uniref:hypothetical protein n=1 Tax=Streptomyces sp. HNM0574 TaxID=2714954 RepID=UPI00146F63D7|nr:hypothetical protein [Streptomyces sp. HNM0574]NLU67891.1 hypothetical protein [Streptomyces sp. HNM0574]